ncbi:MAG: phage major capsid protein, partial [Proteobacteria bacterium]
TAYWVGEGQAKPISKQAFGDLLLEPLKVVSITVATQELLKFSNPKADETLQDDMQAATVESMDLAFVDPQNAGVPGVRPASITYDVALPRRHDDDATRGVGQRSGITNPHTAGTGKDMMDRHGFQRSESQAPALANDADGGRMEVDDEGRQEAVITGHCHALSVCPRTS